MFRYLFQIAFVAFNISFLLLPVSNVHAEGDWADEQRDIELVLAKKLAKQINCEDSAHGSCYLRYEGLDIELANMHTATRPNIYVHSVGKGQYVLPIRGDCLQIFFTDPALKTPRNKIIDASVLLASSGRLVPFFGSSKEENCIGDMHRAK